MGDEATLGQINYAAKYTFNDTTANCTSDFVVFNTSLLWIQYAGQTIVAYDNIYMGCGLGSPVVLGLQHRHRVRGLNIGGVLVRRYPVGVRPEQRIRREPSTFDVEGEFG